jgi:enoyl-CoA hydratase
LDQDHLLVAELDDVLTLTINRPEKRNALSLALLDDIGATLAAHTHSANVKCAVITAAGDRCFAAGGDLKELDAIRSPEQALAMSQRGRRALDAVRFFPLPVIAALNGLALGGGAELAMACDQRVAVTGAEIGFLQGQLNVTTAWGGGIDLIDAIGHQQALEMLLTSKRVPADQALTLGLVNRVCSPDQILTDAVQDFVAPYLQRSQQVLRGFKALTVSARQAAHDRAVGAEESHFVATWTHADHWEAVAKATARRSRSSA